MKNGSGTVASSGTLVRGSGTSVVRLRTRAGDVVSEVSALPVLGKFKIYFDASTNLPIRAGNNNGIG